MADVYSYIRWSTDKQDQGTSPSRQTDAIKRFCEHYKCSVVEELTDAGISSFRGKNYHQGKLGEVVQRALSGNIPKGSILLFESADRMSRMNLGNATQLFMDILASGLHIGICDSLSIFTKESLNIGSFIPLLVEMERAHGESKRKRGFTQSVWKRKLEQQKQGMAVTGKCPQWLKIEEGKFIPIPEQVQVITDLFTTTLTTGVAEATRSINEKYGKDYKIHQTQYLLKNRKLIGEHTQRLTNEDGIKEDGETFQDAYPSVIDPGLFYEVQEKLKSRKPWSGRFEKTHSNFLTGLLKCRYCYSSVRFMRKGVKEYYYCTSSLTHKCRNPGTQSVRAEGLRRAFLNLDEFTKVREFLSASADESIALERQITVLRTSLSPKIAKKAVLQNKLIEADEETTNIFVSAIRQINTEISSLEARIATLEGQRSEALQLAGAQIHIDQIEWLVASDEPEAIAQRQKLNRELKKLFKHIRIDFKNKILYFKPNREGFYPDFWLAFDPKSVPPEMEP